MIVTMMESLTNSFALEIMTFSAMLLCIGMLVSCLLVDDLHFLGAPGFLLVPPSLIAGMR